MIVSEQQPVRDTNGRPVAATPDADFPPLRFLLTFDDGPHVNTAGILRHLAQNSMQPGVKAIFFVQTRSSQGGGCLEGRALLYRTHIEGHVLGLHTGTRRGHVSHTGMPSSELDRSLRDGKEDLCALMGYRPALVRPPYWRFNSKTLEHYERHGLSMMLSDIKAYDGVNWGMHVFKRRNFRSQLRRTRNRLLDDRLPVVNGSIPIVVTFHDTNTYTARHVDDYLHLLREETRRAGLPLHEKPFYDDGTDIMEVALRRAVRQTTDAPTRKVCLAAQ